MGLIFFGLSSLSVFAVAGLLSVYAFGHFEPAWGRGGSAQVMLGAALVGSIVAVFSFGFAAAVFKRFPSKRICIV